LRHHLTLGDQLVGFELIGLWLITQDDVGVLQIFTAGNDLLPGTLNVKISGLGVDVKDAGSFHSWNEEMGALVHNVLFDAGKVIENYCPATTVDWKGEKFE
jgi:hypothetical protein